MDKTHEENEMHFVFKGLFILKERYLIAKAFWDLIILSSSDPGVAEYVVGVVSLMSLDS